VWPVSNSGVVSRHLTSLLKSSALAQLHHDEPMMLSLAVHLSLFLTVCHAAFPDCANGPLKGNLVCDTTAGYKDRATALVAEFTLAELASNSVNSASGIPRLGLPPYNWWSEALVSLSSCGWNVFDLLSSSTASHLVLV
jgi:hypothetical protein